MINPPSGMADKPVTIHAVTPILTKKTEQFVESKVPAKKRYPLSEWCRNSGFQSEVEQRLCLDSVMFAKLVGIGDPIPVL